MTPSVSEIASDPNFDPLEPVPVHAVYGSTRIPQRVRVVSDLVAQCLDNQASPRLQ